MNKKTILSVALIATLLSVTGCSATVSNEDYTRMEQMLYDANKYTLKNSDNIEVIQEEQQIFEDQEALVDGYTQEYNNGDYSLDNPYIVVNPYERNELAAYIAFNSEDSIKYSYSVVTNDTDYPFEYSTEEYSDGDIVIPVIGLFEDTDNDVELTIETETGESTTTTIVITTEEASSNYKEGGHSKEELLQEAGLVLTDEEAAAMGSAYVDVDDEVVETTIYDDSVFDYSDGFILSETLDVFDFDGNIRSSTPDYEYTAPIKIDNGLFLMMSTPSTYLELDVMGRVHDVISVPANKDGEQQFSFHHDATISSDGQYYYLLGSWRGTVPEEDNEDIVTESLVFKYDRESGEFVAFWDYNDDLGHLDQSAWPVASEDDPIHMNSIDYYEYDNSLIISMKNQSGVMAIDADTGEIDWLVKDDEGITTENTEWLLDAVGDDMVYTSGQHTAFIMDTEKYDTDGDTLYISIYDNRNCVDEDQTPAWSVIGDDATDVCAYSELSSMVIYKIDLSARTVETMEELTPADRWSFTKGSVFTNHEGIYEVHYADLSDEVSGEFTGTTFAHSDLYVTDEDGNVLTKTTFDGMTNIYRSRLVNNDELGESLLANLEF